jgi:hypothetical protein
MRAAYQKDAIATEPVSPAVARGFTGSGLGASLTSLKKEFKENVTGLKNT